MRHEIIPVILAKDLTDFKSKLAIIKSLRPKPRWVQIDVVDGKFAPWRTWPINPNCLNHELGIMNYEIDLMVIDPLQYAKKWIAAGAKRILFHIEPKATKNPLQIIKYIKSKKRQVGISINAKTPLFHLTPYIKYVDCVLLLGVDPGRSGQTFQPQVLKKIRALRKKYPALPIEVDGGVNLKNAQAILSAGATRLAAASAILKSSNPQKAYQQLLKIIQCFQNS